MEPAETTTGENRADSESMACFVVSLLVHLLLLLAALVAPLDPFELESEADPRDRVAGELSIRIVEPVSNLPPTDENPLVGESDVNQIGKTSPPDVDEDADGHALGRAFVEELPESWRGESKVRGAESEGRSARFEGTSKSRVLCPGCSDCARYPDHEACRGVDVDIQYRPVLLRTRQPVVDELLSQRRLEINVCLRTFVPPDASLDIPVILASGSSSVLIHRLDSGISELDACMRKALEGVSPVRSAGVVSATLKIRYSEDSLARLSGR